MTILTNILICTGLTFSLANYYLYYMKLANKDAYEYVIEHFIIGTICLFASFILFIIKLITL